MDWRGKGRRGGECEEDIRWVDGVGVCIRQRGGEEGVKWVETSTPGQNLINQA